MRMDREAVRVRREGIFVSSAAKGVGSEDNAGETGFKLRGDRNQCRGCGEWFNSTGAFDKHRTGDFGGERRCMDEEEMLRRGMVKNATGFWIRKAFAGQQSWWAGK